MAFRVFTYVVKPLTVTFLILPLNGKNFEDLGTSQVHRHLLICLDSMASIVELGAGDRDGGRYHFTSFTEAMFSALLVAVFSGVICECKKYKIGKHFPPSASLPAGGPISLRMKNEHHHINGNKSHIY